MLGCTSLLADGSVDIKYSESLWRPFLNGQLELQQIADLDEENNEVFASQDRTLKLTISNDSKFVPTVGLQTNIKDHKRRSNIDTLIVFDSVAFTGGKMVDSQVDLTCLLYTSDAADD